MAMAGASADFAAALSNSKPGESLVLSMVGSKVRVQIKTSKVQEVQKDRKKVMSPPMMKLVQKKRPAVNEKHGLSARQIAHGWWPLKSAK